MKSNTHILLALMLIGLAACKPKYLEVQPRVGPVTEAVFASGSIEPKDVYTLTSLFDGYLLQAYTTEGDMVKQGQLLFRLDNRQQFTQVDVAAANERYAAANIGSESPQLGQAQTQVNTAAAKRATDSLNLSRMERLLTTHSVSAMDVDNARLAFRTSVNNHIAALENLRSTRNRVAQDYAVSQAQLRNARAGNQYYDLEALSAGKVYQVFRKQGDLVRKGDQVARIGSPDSIIINLDIDEGSIAKLQLGQQVFVELNTEKDRQYAAHITRIYPNFNDANQSYRAEAQFDTQPGHLISGTQLQANIITQKKEKALLIPAVFLAANDKVVVKSSKGADTVAIKKGIVSDEWVEVISGLTGNETLLRLK